MTMRLRLRPHREPAFQIEDHGVAVLIVVLNEDGDRWLRRHYGSDPFLFGDRLVVARRSAGRIVAAIRRAGLAVCYREDDF